MKYLGGKSRLGKEIAHQVRCRLRSGINTILEPFCGACWVTQYFYYGTVIASDLCESLILMHQAIQRGWEPPDYISESEYDEMRHVYNEGEINPLIGFCGFAASWGGKWFGGYARGDSRNYCLEAKRSILKKHKNLKHVTFQYRNYKNLNPENCLIYCDPPYHGTTRYSFGISDISKFWDTMRKWSERNIVIISEYRAPKDFKCIWECEHVKSVGTGQTVERLFQCMHQKT